MSKNKVEEAIDFLKENHFNLKLDCPDHISDIVRFAMDYHQKQLELNAVVQVNPDVVNRRELLLDWEKYSYGSEWSMHKDQIVPSIDEYLSQ